MQHDSPRFYVPPSLGLLHLLLEVLDDHEHDLDNALRRGLLALVRSRVGTQGGLPLADGVLRLQVLGLHELQLNPVLLVELFEGNDCVPDDRDRVPVELVALAPPDLAIGDLVIG